MVTIERSDWDALREQFSSFFAGCGTVRSDADIIEFDGAPSVETRLTLRSDGTSTSFMPLHGLETRWDRVHFDRRKDEVTLDADGVSYVYRVPPALR
ncbi:MAG: hypothetical protein HKN01_07505 [Acidimicrobiia bacterium]|nr:hypothetical protein [Acidimicrobiia bacterium]